MVAACELEQLVFVPVVEDVAIRDIGELASVTEVVNNDDLFPALTQRTHEIATDKTRPAGNDKHDEPDYCTRAAT